MVQQHGFASAGIQWPISHVVCHQLLTPTTEMAHLPKIDRNPFLANATWDLKSTKFNEILTNNSSFSRFSIDSMCFRIVLASLWSDHMTGMTLRTLLTISTIFHSLIDFYPRKNHSTQIHFKLSNECDWFHSEHTDFPTRTSIWLHFCITWTIIRE